MSQTDCCIQGCVLLQTDLISAVRAKVQTPLFCVLDVLCWHFSLHINSVLSELSAPHLPVQPTSIYHAPPSSSSIDWGQFVLVQHIFLSQTHTDKNRDFCRMCFSVPKSMLVFFPPAFWENVFSLQKTQDLTLTPHFSLTNGQDNKNGIKMRTDLVGGTVGRSSGWKPGRLCKPGGSCPGTDWPVRHSPRGFLTDAPDLRHKAQGSATLNWQNSCHAYIIKLENIF